ncbi:MAG: kinase [Nitrospirae bacterium]|nr:MAG: kinase [Nitrospirota bacterium]
MIITRTPFRVSFFGGGTDFPAWYREHGGAVLSTTIDKYSYIHCRKLPPFFDHKHKVVFFSKHEDFNDIDEIVHPAVRETYRFMNVNEGLLVQHDGDLPSHSGLGSSSAFTVGLLNALYALQGKMVNKKRLALEAIHVEQEMIKEAVGSQDQIAVSFGGFNKIVFSANNIEVNPVTISSDNLAHLHSHLMLFFTGFPRFAVEIEKEKIRNLGNKKHELRSMQRMVESAVDILNDGVNGYDDFGRLLHESWLLKKNLSDKVSTSQIDDIYAKAMTAGALGGKILGAGGGGFILFYIVPEKQEQLKSALSPLLHVPFRFDTLGSQVIYYAVQ